MMAPSDAHPRARRSAAAVIHNGAFTLHGGLGVGADISPSSVHGDFWMWRKRRLSRSGWETGEHQLPPVRFPSLVSTGKALVRFGGLSELGGRAHYLNTLWTNDGGGWRRIETSGPSPSPRYCAAIANRAGSFIIFGGTGADGPCNDVWIFDGDWVNLSINGRPSPRHGFSWAASKYGLTIFGGFDGEHDLSEVWTLTLDTLEWLSLPPMPEPRIFPVVGIVGDDKVVFGGRLKTNPKANFSQTWLFNGEWSEFKGHGPGYHAKTAYASDGRSLWMYGGEGPCGHVSDLWRYTSKGWECLSRPRGDDPVMW